VAVGWIIGVLVPLGFAGVIVGLRRNAVRLTRRIAVPQADPAVTFRGGFWSRITGGTKGYRAKLEFFDWGIRLRGSKLGGFLLPVYEIRYHELIDVQMVATRLRHGIRLRSEALPAPMNFETYRDTIPRIVVQLEERNVPVNRQVGHMGWLPGD
jgi:hypothetical protein